MSSRLVEQSGNYLEETSVSSQVFRVLSLGGKKMKTKPNPNQKRKRNSSDCIWIPSLKFYLVLISSSNREL